MPSIGFGTDGVPLAEVLAVTGRREETVVFGVTDLSFVLVRRLEEKHQEDQSL